MPDCNMSEISVTVSPEPYFRVADTDPDTKVEESTVDFTTSHDMLAQIENKVTFCRIVMHKYAMQEHSMLVPATFFPSMPMTVRISRADRKALLHIFREGLEAMCPPSRPEFVLAHEYLVDHWSFHWHPCSLDAKACMEALLWIEFSDVYPIADLSYEALSYVYAWMAILQDAREMHKIARALMTSDEYADVKQIQGSPPKVVQPLIDIFGGDAIMVDLWLSLLSNNQTFHRAWLRLVRHSIACLTLFEEKRVETEKERNSIVAVYNELLTLLSLHHGRRLSSQSPWRCIFDWYREHTNDAPVPKWMNMVFQDITAWNHPCVRRIRDIFYPCSFPHEATFDHILQCSPDSSVVQEFWTTYKMSAIEKAVKCLSYKSYHADRPGSPSVTLIIYKTMMYLIGKMPGYTKPPVKSKV